MKAFSTPTVTKGQRTHPVWREEWHSKVLLLLLGTDLLFIGLHLLRFWLLQEGSYEGFLLNSRFTVDRDRGFAEGFQYLKLLLIVGLLMSLWVRQKALSYGAWGATFAFTLLDDALKIHEGVGRRIVDWLNIPAAFGLRGQDFGELIVWGGFGIILLGILLFSYLRAAPKEKAFSNPLFLLFVAFVFFGLGVDMLHMLLGGSEVQQMLMAVLEDGGEMFVMSIITVYIWNIFRGREKRLRCNFL